jgi:hypothetical protein
MSGVFPLYDNITECRNRWKVHFQRGIDPHPTSDPYISSVWKKRHRNIQKKAEGDVIY